MRFRLAVSALSVVLLAGLMACNQEDPQRLKEKTAQATADLKSNAKAVAEGVREGWSRDKPLDINHATQDQLESLPGMTTREANAIIAGRPYSEPKELVDRRIMSEGEYDKISDRVTAK
jgi:DNA uptake protein ComE-like DNA-binding protein